MKSILGVPFALLLLGACTDDLGGPSPSLRAVTDHPVYASGQSGAALVTFTLHHDGGRAVALNGCPHPPALILERRRGGAWEQAYSTGLVCLAIYRPETISLLAGGQVSTVLEVVGVGQYRVRALIGPAASTPELTLYSNRFELR